MYIHSKNPIIKVCPKCASISIVKHCRAYNTGVKMYRCSICEAKFDNPYIMCGDMRHISRIKRLDMMLKDKSDKK